MYRSLASRFRKGVDVIAAGSSHGSIAVDDEAGLLFAGDFADAGVFSRSSFFFAAATSLMMMMHSTSSKASSLRWL